MKTWLKSTLIAAAVGFLALSGAVLSQTISVPTVSVLHPTDLIQIIPYGQPSAQSQYATMPAVTHTFGYYKTPTTVAAGFEYQFGSFVTYAAFTNTGTLASGYVVLEANPSDGARNCVFAVGQITALYICISSTGPANCVTTGINNPLAGTLSANSGICYLYSASNANWDRD